MGALILSPLISVLTWPVSRLAHMGRVYELSIPSSDTCPLIRGGVAVDPLFRDFRVANARSVKMEVVGRVVENRFEIYRSGKYSSGIGLVGTVEDTPAGSRVLANVGWGGPTKWVMPAITVMAIIGVIGIATEVPREMSNGADTWASVALGVMVVGGQLGNLVTRYRWARDDDLPVLLEHLERLLGPYKR